jgi:CBS domain-containing protein
MKVSEVMTRSVRTVAPNQSIQDAGSLMEELDIGVLPVADNDRLVGMITDRDIAVRAVAKGRGPETTIREAMTKDVKYCFDDQTIDEVTQNMADIRVRRLPVVDRGKRLVGILSLGDIATNGKSQDEAGEALQGISRPGGEHSQSANKH